MRQLEKRDGEREQHDVADQLEHALERQRRQNLRALHVRGSRDEHDARRFAAVGDENVVQPAPAKVALSAIQSDGAPTGRRKIHQRTALSASDSEIDDARRASRIVRFASAMLCHVVCQLTFAREQHERHDDRDAQADAKDARDGFLHAASSRSNRYPCASKRSTISGTACAVCIRSP